MQTFLISTWRKKTFSKLKPSRVELRDGEEPNSLPNLNLDPVMLDSRNKPHFIFVG